MHFQGMFSREKLSLRINDFSVQLKGKFIEALGLNANQFQLEASRQCINVYA